MESFILFSDDWDIGKLPILPKRMAKNHHFDSPFPICFVPPNLCTVLGSISTMMLQSNYHGHPHLVPVFNSLLSVNLTGNKMNHPIHIHPSHSILPSILFCTPSAHCFTQQCLWITCFSSSLTLLSRLKSGHLIQGLTLDPDASLPPSWSYFKEVIAALCPLKVTFPSPLRRLKIRIDPSS